MHKNHPIVTTAKLRALVKKNEIGYVDRTRRQISSMTNGVAISQLGSDIYVEGFGFNDQIVIAQNIAKFDEALASLGLTLTKLNDSDYKVVKVGA